MAVKIVALYGQPTDPSAWDGHYQTVHLPLAAKLPGLSAQRAARASGTLDGKPSPYYAIGELVFDDLEAMQKALASAEGQAAAEDLAAMAPPQSLIFLAEDY
jgi:uncharacterized protein (TIGR02118 family)